MPRTKKNKKTNKTTGVRRGDGGIKKPTEHDVLQGRGGQANNWIGNKTYRAKVDKRKPDYVRCQRAQKTAMSRDLVREWREQKPPGRFLEQDGNDGLWYEIGDKKARRKTSQLLREDAPNLRENLRIDEPINNDSGSDTSGGSEDEWLPKGTKTVEPTAVARPKRRKSLSVNLALLATAERKPPAAAAAEIKVKPTGSRRTQQPQQSKKTPPAKKMQLKKHPAKGSSTKKDKGTTFVSKKDLYQAVKDGRSIPGVTLSTTLNVASNPTTSNVVEQQSSPPKNTTGGEEPNLQNTTATILKLETATTAPCPQDSATANNETTEGETNDPHSPPLGYHEPPQNEDEMIHLQIEPRVEPPAMEPMAFGGYREMSWSSMGPYMRPLLDEDTTEPSFFLDLESNARGNVGDQPPPLEPLDFESGGANDEGRLEWEAYEGMGTQGDEESDGRFSLLI